MRVVVSSWKVQPVDQVLSNAHQRTLVAVGATTSLVFWPLHRSGTSRLRGYATALICGLRSGRSVARAFARRSRSDLASPVYFKDADGHAHWEAFRERASQLRAAAHSVQKQLYAALGDAFRKPNCALLPGTVPCYCLCIGLRSSMPQSCSTHGSFCSHLWVTLTILFAVGREIAAGREAGVAT